jgi:transposase
MGTVPMTRSDGFTVESQTLGALPVINHFLGRLGLDQLLCRYVPCDDARLRLAPAATLGVLIRNLIVNRRPVYALGQWASAFAPDELGFGSGDAGLLNDDRVGRMLNRLFDCDRASFATELALAAITAFGVDCSELHNDSTTITFKGAYASTRTRRRGGKRPALITHGHNKDYRPDLKQLLWILTVSRDGAVPIAYRSADGNTNDDVTHIPTWDGLVTLVGAPSFLYVADSKLCNRAAMDHIAARGGRFVTVLPKSRKEEGFFREWVKTHTPQWAEFARRPSGRAEAPEAVWRAVESPMPSSEGYRIVWFWSSTKSDTDQHARRQRIEAGIKALGALNNRVGGLRSRFHSEAAVERAAEAALERARARRWFDFTVKTKEVERFQRQRWKNGYVARRRIVDTRFEINWEVRRDVVAGDAKSDGCLPLITNDSSLSHADLLAAHKYQPCLETRHAQLKGTQLVAPVFLKDPVRIEALLFCHFIALLVHALIERQIRTAMESTGTEMVALYPEERACRAPTAARVLDVFADAIRHRLMRGPDIVQDFDPKLSPLQLEVLDLLGVPHGAYSNAKK